MASLMEKLLKESIEKIKVKDVEDYHPIVKLIKECWGEIERDK